MKTRSVYIASGALAAIAVVLLFLPPLSESTAANAEPSALASAQVKIDNFSFAPQTLTVPVGTTVTWTNRDDIPHTIVSTDGVFKSKVRDTDETFSYTFTKAGTYNYFCSVHPKMTGKIIVQ
jgi:plastocyanin